MYIIKTSVNLKVYTLKYMAQNKNICEYKCIYKIYHV